MANPVLDAAILLYVAAAAAHAVAFVRPGHARVARAAVALTMGGFVVHAAAIGLGCAETHGRHLLTVVGTAGLVAWLAAGAFLVAQRTLRKPVVGALVLPLVIASIVPAALSPGRVAGVPAATSVVPALRLHVITAAGGIALLALAFAVALMFLAQERELKGKHFGPMLSRLPPLLVLERVNAVLLAAGFGVFTVAVASGAVVARSAWCALWSRTPSRSRQGSYGPCSARWSSRASRGAAVAGRP